MGRLLRNKRRVLGLSNQNMNSSKGSTNSRKEARGLHQVAKSQGITQMEITRVTMKNLISNLLTLTQILKRKKTHTFKFLN